MKTFATGRGREMTAQGRARNCAKAVISGRKAAGYSRYNVNYFGTAMREHVRLIQKDGLVLSIADQALLDKAEAVLREYCDGQDCSFQQVM